MASKAQIALKGIVKKLKNILGDSAKPNELIPLSRFVIDIIVKRTRLGYGVNKNFGTKQRLKPLSTKYKDYRARFPNLSASTSPGKSNLTLTGQMLESMQAYRIQNGKVVIGPTGSRKGSFLTNLKVADYQEEQGRTFNRLSGLEFQQVLRFYRKRFGDLLKKKNLIA